MKLARALLSLILLTVPASRAEAQSAYVNGLRDLAFGTVLNGVPKHILPSDAVNSGMFEFKAAGAAQVQLQFTLPTVLNGPAGATLPISFSTTDAIVQGLAGGSTPLTINPNVTTVYPLGSGSRFDVWIGGTVTPQAGQTQGAYSATISLTMTVL
jgi:hypothetical protein